MSHTDSFLKIIAMNMAFGNSTPTAPLPDEEATYHMHQAIKMARTELVEYEKARANMDVDEQADAVIDAIVYLVGGLYKAGIDPMQSLDNVLSSLMTRFVKDPKDEAETLAWYESMGLTKDDISIEGEYPNRVFRSKIEKFDFECQKFLKSKNYQKPTPWARAGKNPRKIFCQKLQNILPVSEEKFKVPKSVQEMVCSTLGTPTVKFGK